LEYLAIFHFVGVGLSGLGILLLLGHYAAFHTLFANPQTWAGMNKPSPPPPELFSMLKWLYIVFGVWFVVSGIANLLSGLCLRARKHRMFSFLVAAMNCIHFPLGTVLGVFTFVVLARDSVREVYAQT
jgi:hypothetical protein